MSIVIKGGRLIDGTGKPPLDRAVVVVEDKQIKAIGAEGQVAPPTGAKVVEADGRTVLPALMDLHGAIARLTLAEEPYGITAKNIAASILRGVANGRRCLDVGVTTVRAECGHHGLFALKEAYASGVVEGPRLIFPGRGICMTGGHFWHSGSCREADGADGVRKAVREELREGADWIKLMVTGGAGSPTERVEDVQLTLEELKAAVEEAHKKGKYAMAHVSCAEGARLSIDAGVDSVEHGLVLDEDNIQQMKTKGVFLIPTLGVYRNLVERGEKKQVPEFMYQRGLQVVKRHAESFRMALAAGLKIAAGTDSGADWYYMGESLLWELEIMNSEGMAPMECLKSATSRAAECLRMMDTLGTLEAGKLADILIVEGDPLSNVSELRNTWMVFKEGRLVFKKGANNLC